MTAFMASVAALTAIVLLVLLMPLLGSRRGGRVSRRALNIAVYRDQIAELDAELGAGSLSAAEHDKARRELEARLLEDVEQPAAQPSRRSGRWAAIALGLAVPVLALGLYGLVGNPGALVGTSNTAQPPTHGVTQAEVEAMVAKLAARMREHPDEAEGWIMLGRSYAALGRMDESVDAYAHAVKLEPQNADLLADYADVLGFAQGKRLIGKPEELIAKALQIDPRNVKALALAGTAAFQRQDYKSAAAYWQRILPLVPPDSEDARALLANVNEARARAGEPPIAAEAPAAAPQAASLAPLTGTVTLSPALAAKASPDESVFIYARAADGPPMPLAVLRKRVRDLPVAFSLDDSMAMAPGLALSRFQKVVVGARISKSGSATPSPGDLQGLSEPVANDARDVRVVIDSVVR
ncbi:MAG: c-type cytochrome biogenesis protein CcmI [Betaproteobacteria bacterium]|nr:c-type cytochrome biogenesis protein CcmI [Betaproteobacteria bacterium]